MIGGPLPSQASAVLASSQSAAGLTPIPRRELLLWIVVWLFANQTLLLLNVESLDAFSASLLTQNDIYWLACGVAVYRLYASDQSVSANRVDCVLAVALGVCILLSSLLPYRFGIGLLATLVAIYLLRFDRGDRNLKAAGYVLLAVSTQLVWGPIVFQLFTPELLKADAALVGTMLTGIPAGYHLERHQFLCSGRPCRFLDRRLLLLQQRAPVLCSPAWRWPC